MCLIDYSTIWPDWKTLSPREKWNRVARRQRRYREAISHKIEELERVEDVSTNSADPIEKKIVDKRRKQDQYISSEYLSIAEICEKYGSARMTITRAFRFGCRKIKRGKSSYIHEEDFLSYKEEMRQLKVASAKRCTAKRTIPKQEE